ncbi:MAG: hypothetical protein ACRCV9_11435, partial [Burkholderiaceae bacterium]
MSLRNVSLFRAVFVFAALVCGQAVEAAGVNFAGNTANAAAAVAMNSSTTHISDFRQAAPLLVSTQGKYPPVDYKPQIFQHEYSLIRVPDPRSPKRNEFILKNNDK